MTGRPLLQVQDLRVEFPHGAVLDGLSIDVQAGQVVGLVGETGAGKSVTALAVMRLLPTRGVRVSGGVHVDGVDLLTLDEARMFERRGRDIAMLVEDSRCALHPVIPVGVQLGAAVARHRGVDRAAARATAEDLLDRVGIPEHRRFEACPHELPVGVRHRVAIAVAMAGRLLIADEPTAGLDPTLAAQILGLIVGLARESGTALILCTPDIGIVAGTCDTVNVLFGGRIVERAGRHRLFGTPRHPYTHGLLRAIPRLDMPPGELVPLRGGPTDNLPWGQGCAFAGRCPRTVERCAGTPPVADDSGGRLLRCHNPVPASAE